MANALVEKLRRSREFVLDAGGHKFTLRRPTDADVVEMPNATAIEYVRRFVIGWDVRELDVIPGGGPEPVPFDAETWAAWVDDHAELWEPIAAALLDAYREHAAKRETAQKN